MTEENEVFDMTKRTDTPEASQARGIAARIVDLKDAELLVLTAPLALTDPDLTRLARELQYLLPAELRERRLPVIVLREGMSLDKLSSEQLQRAGLRRV